MQYQAVKRITVYTTKRYLIHNTTTRLKKKKILT